jgi:hypothetical protein
VEEGCALQDYLKQQQYPAPSLIDVYTFQSVQYEEQNTLTIQTAPGAAIQECEQGVDQQPQAASSI